MQVAPLAEVEVGISTIHLSFDSLAAVGDAAETHLSLETREASVMCTAFLDGTTCQASLMSSVCGRSKQMSVIQYIPQNLNPINPSLMFSMCGWGKQRAMSLRFLIMVTDSS